MAGQRLGHFEILEKLGAGGMGEVYKARDSRLDRIVAIKVLPPGFASDGVAVRRLQREARLIASLSHPHICPLFEVGHENGTDFLVMEYLEGETLAERLKRGKLPLALALRHGVQIASAVAAAHTAGIIHRDLKPGNVMLTKTGARLLDFGLAKQREVISIDDEGRTGNPPDTNHGRHHLRHHRLHVARAGGRQARGHTIRHLQLRDASLRDGQRAASLPRRLQPRDARSDSREGSCAACRRPAGRTPENRLSLSAQEPG